MPESTITVWYVGSHTQPVRRVEQTLKNDSGTSWRVHHVQHLSAIPPTGGSDLPELILLEVSTDGKIALRSSEQSTMERQTDRALLLVTDGRDFSPPYTLPVACETISVEHLDSPLLPQLLRSTLQAHLVHVGEEHAPLANARRDRRLHDIIEHNVDGILIVDRSGAIRFVNPAAEALFECPASELIGSTFGYPAVAGETTEIDILRTSGPPRVAEMRVSTIEWDREPCFLASIRDVTEQIQARQALKESEARFRQLAENIPAVFWLIRLEPHPAFEYISPPFEALWGFKRQDVYDNHKAWLDHIHPGDRPSEQERFRNFIQSHGDYKAEYRIIRSDGSVRWVWSKGFAVLDDEGNVSRLAGLTQDVTQSKEEQERQQMLVQELKTFAYVVSHDLRTPLINLKGFSTEMRNTLKRIDPLLREAASLMSNDHRQELETSLEEDIHEALEFITTSVSRMDRLINSILKFSRLGRRDLMYESLDMNQIVKETIHTLAYQIEEKQVSVSVDHLPDLVADRLSMEQILSNLLGNALSYLDPARPGRIHVGGRRLIDETVFLVQDNGRGIEARDLHRIFDLFRRAGSEEVPGEGVGLAYVRTLVRRHGGSVWCESEPGVGSTFTFRIPDRLPPASDTGNSRIGNGSPG